MIELKEINFTYKNAKNNSLNNIDLEIKGEFV